jgi:hypothetical protein
VNETDQIETLATILAQPAPSSETVNRGRRQLQQVIAGRRGGRRRRRGRVGAGLGLAATAAAGAVAAAAVLNSGTGPAAPGPAGPGAGDHRTVRLSAAQQILLTAAAAAARAPARTGTYWYDKQTWTGPGYHETVEFWTPHSGSPTWARGKQKTNGRLVRVGGRPGYNLAANIGPFYSRQQLLKLRRLARQRPHKPVHVFSGRPTLVSFSQLQKLPTSPAALTAWLTAFDRHYARQTGDPFQAIPADFMSLTSLIAEMPAPPAVRAAAFRAMAALPGVTSLGPVSGGQGLRLPLGGMMSATVVVNTATSQVRDILTIDGGGEQASSVSDTAHWVNRLP